MPLNQYFHRCNQLLGMLEIYIRSDLRIKKLQDDIFDDEEETEIRTIHETKKEIMDVERKKFEEELNIAGMKYIIENVDRHKKNISTDYHELRSITDEMALDKDVFL
jgi:hypothetical protein